jgi:hypothetical protein
MVLQVEFPFKKRRTYRGYGKKSALALGNNLKFLAIPFVFFFLYLGEMHNFF